MENTKTLLNLINTYNNPSLVKPNESPNGNIITLIWNDGEITNTKGGSAFLRRSLFTVIGPISKGINIKMPILYGNFSYAIVDLNHAYEIRNVLERI